MIFKFWHSFIVSSKTKQQESVKILVCTWLLFDYLHFISINMATVVNHNWLQNLFCILNILHVPFISLPKWLETAMQSFKFLLKLWKNRFIENNMTFLLIMTKKYSIMLRNINQGPGQIPFFQQLELKFDKQATHSLLSTKLGGNCNGRFGNVATFQFPNGAS